MLQKTKKTQKQAYLLSEEHGRRSRGDGRGTSPPRIWSGEIVPPDFVMLQNLKHQITCITM